MKNSICFILLAIFMLGGAISAAAQKCYSNYTPKFTVQENEKKFFFLPTGERLKVALTNEIDSERSRTGDYVQFTTLEPLYGRLCEEKVWNKKTKQFEPTPDEGKRILLAKEGANVFGTIDFAQSSLPFWIRGKSKLFVFVRSIQLENGLKIPIRFALPEGEFIKNLTGQQKEKLLRPCKTQKSLQECITGRRTKLVFDTAIIAGLAGAIIGFVKDTVTDELLVGLTVTQSVASNAKTIVNPPQAKLEAKKVIYDVITIADTNGFLIKTEEEIKAAEKKKKEAKEAKEKICPPGCSEYCCPQL